MLLGPLGASFLGNLLTSKGVNEKGKETNRAGEGVIRAGFGRISFSALHNNIMDF